MSDVNGLSRAYESTRYSDPHNILRSEIIYGEGFQSPGGVEGFLRTLVDRMPIREGMTLLDIGSGLGGAAFHLAERFSVEVVGIDTAAKMIDLAQARRRSEDPAGRTRFILGDIHTAALHPDSFDIIYSRDVLMYEPEKGAVFERCHRLLKAGGYLCITDFGVGRRTPAFTEYMDVSKYHLLSTEDYARLVERAGFSATVAEDISSVARNHLAHDLDLYQGRVLRGDPSIAPEDATHIVERWKRKIDFLDEGSLTQGVYIATKR